jgi:hypothetical protein
VEADDGQKWKLLIFLWKRLQDAHLQGCEKNRTARHKRKRAEMFLSKKPYDK